MIRNGEKKEGGWCNELLKTDVAVSEVEGKRVLNG